MGYAVVSEGHSEIQQFLAAEPKSEKSIVWSIVTDSRDDFCSSR